MRDLDWNLEAEALRMNVLSVTDRAACVSVIEATLRAAYEKGLGVAAASRKATPAEIAAVVSELRQARDEVAASMPRREVARAEMEAALREAIESGCPGNITAMILTAIEDEAWRRRR